MPPELLERPMRKRSSCLQCLIVLAMFSVPLLAQAPAETITIDADAPAHPFPHFWEQMFGSGRASPQLARVLSPRLALGPRNYRISLRALSRHSRR